MDMRVMDLMLGYRVVWESSHTVVLSNKDHVKLAHYRQ